MDGKIVLVTGATNGIGEITALELARKGATVVIVSRSQQKLDATADRIMAETGKSVTTIQADLSIMADVRNVADTFLQQFDRLDVLVNNAGAYYDKRFLTTEGFEMTFALNHLNYFLLTHLLLDTLKSTAKTVGEARIVNVSSDAHHGGRIDLNDLQLENGYSSWTAYGASKLMNVLFTYELARQLEGTNVTANVLHPGFVNTGFGMNAGGVLKTALGIMQNLFAKTPEQGAETSIYLASSPAVKGITGKYWADSKQKSSNNISYDVDLQKQLWEISEQLAGIAVPVV